MEDARRGEYIGLLTTETAGRLGAFVVAGGDWDIARPPGSLGFTVWLWTPVQREIGHGASVDAAFRAALDKLARA